MTEAHPEAKVVVKTRKTRHVSTLLHITYYPDMCWQDDSTATVSMDSSDMRVLDVSTWTQRDHFKTFCKEATVWKVTCSELQLQLRHQASSISEVPLLLPDVIVDEDPLEAVLLA